MAKKKVIKKKVTKKKKSKLDWEAIWRDFRPGILSKREIGRVHSVDPSYMLRKAKELGIKQDLKKQVQQAVDTKLVHGLVHTHGASDEEIIDEASDRVVDVIKLHRKDIQDTRETVTILLAQLVEAATDREGLEEAIEEETKDDKSPKRRAQMLKAVSLLSHSSIIGNLTTALARLIPMERQAHNLNDGDDGNEGSKRVTGIEVGFV